MERERDHGYVKGGLLEIAGMAKEGGSFTPKCLILFPLLLFLAVSLLISSTIVPVPSFHVCPSSPTFSMNSLSAGSNSLQEAKHVSCSTSIKNLEPVIRKDLNNSRTEKTDDVNVTTEKTFGSSPEEDRAKRMHVNEEASYSPPELAVQVDQAKRQEFQYAVGIIQGQIHKLRSIGRDHTYQGTCRHECEGKGIFGYDLPPKFNKQLMDGCADILPWTDFCRYLANQGMGKRVPGLGRNWYGTNQFSLEPIFHSRIMNHSCRVFEEEKASLFYIPFYAGLNVLRMNFRNVSVEEKDQLGLELVQWLRSKRTWTQNEGRDHFLALGTLSWDFRRISGVWGTNFLELKEMQNPVKLIIERQPWHLNDIGIPYPTNFHPSTDKEITKFQSKLFRSKRKILVSFAGAGRPKVKDNVRSFLIEECVNNSSLCTYLDCRSDNCMNPRTVIKLFMGSEFCLQPPGDSPTRKSFFDSLVYGCIPVIFSPFTASYQYPWHLPEDHRQYSVFIGQEQVKQGKVKVISTLEGISIEERNKMRRYIIFKLMPRIIYSNSNSKLLKFQDAFMISVDNLLQRVV